MLLALQDLLPRFLLSPDICQKLMLVCKDLHALIRRLGGQQPVKYGCLLNMPGQFTVTENKSNLEIKAWDGHHYIHTRNEISEIVNLNTGNTIATDVIPAEIDEPQFFFLDFAPTETGLACFYTLDTPHRLIILPRNPGAQRATVLLPNLCIDVTCLQAGQRRLLALDYALDSDLSIKMLQFMDITTPSHLDWRLIGPIIQNAHLPMAFGSKIVMHVGEYDTTFHIWDTVADREPHFKPVLRAYSRYTYLHQVMPSQMLIQLKTGQCFTFNSDNTTQGMPWDLAKPSKFRMPSAALPTLRVFIAYHNYMYTLHRMLLPSKDMPVLLIPMRDLALSPELTHLGARCMFAVDDGDKATVYFPAPRNCMMLLGYDPRG